MTWNEIVWDFNTVLDVVEVAFFLILAARWNIRRRNYAGKSPLILRVKDDRPPTRVRH